MAEPRTRTVLQLSDVHLTAEPHGTVNGVDGDERLAVVLSAVDDALATDGAAVDAIVLSGDLADDASAPACARLATAVARFDAPVLAVAGNHDDPVVVAGAFGPLVAVAVDDWRLVGLDTSRPDRIDGEVDLADAERRLAAVAGHPTVVVLHHPPVSLSTHEWFQLVGADALMALLDRSPDVRLAVTGHLHDPFERTTPGGTPLLGAPSTLVSIGHHGAEFAIGGGGPAGARLLHLHPDGSATNEVVGA